MIAFLSLLLHVVVSPFRTKAQLEAEIILLRHQLNVLRRRVPSNPKLAAADRLVIVWLYRLFPSVLNAVTIVQPQIVIDGIGRASDCTGAGSRALEAVVQGSPGKSGARRSPQCACAALGGHSEEMGRYPNRKRAESCV
jgi:hypothetical protein